MLAGMVSHDVIAGGGTNAAFQARVLILSIDGLHGIDLANYIKSNPNSAIARLSQNAVRYNNAYTVKPSDSFPSFLATITGGSPISTGVWYDDSYDRALWPPGVTSGPTGTPVVFTEAVDYNYLAIDGGGGINPDALPRDPARNGAVVYPHDYLRVNTIFEVVKAAGGRTAFCEKHLSYEIANGPSGQGVDDLYTPEIAANNQYGVSITKSVAATEAYDDLKVRAVMNQIAGLDHTGTNANPVPVLFGMNFQAVSVAQKLKSTTDVKGSTLAGTCGYTDGLGTPSAYLTDALNHTDASINQIVTNLQAQGLFNSTYIVLMGKHGNSPMDITRLITAGKANGANPAVNLQGLIDPSVVTVNKLTADDGGLFWLADQSQAVAAASVLRANQTNAYIQDIYAGESLKAAWNDPLTDSRTPDILIFPVPGTIYTTSAKKIAEHGGASEQDTHVALLISNPQIQPQTIQVPIVMTQVAPTILQLLGLNPFDLQAVVREHTPLLPGFEPLLAGISTTTQAASFNNNGTNLLHLSNGQASMQLSEFQTHRYVVQASTDLVNWTDVSTNTLTDHATTTVTDPQATNYSNRFYRAVLIH